MRDDEFTLPSLSVVVPALNEEATIEPAMRSLLSLDYSGLEIVAVDDRSSDRTGEILDGLSAENSHLLVRHISELPPGWLGKNHALHCGSQMVDGEWILFTDADVHFTTDAVRRAVQFAEQNDLDHLVLFPEMEVQGFWEKLYVSYFGVMFSMYAQPWAAKNPRSKAYIGVGAFNLVRTSHYRSVGGHAALPMDVADDMKLGKVMKYGGGKQECVMGGPFVRVRWIVGLRGAIDGSAKNMFAGVEFSPWILARTVAALLIIGVWPAIGLFAGPWQARTLCLATFASMALTVKTSSFLKLNPAYGFVFPLGALVFLYCMVRSAALTYRQGGIVWRGTLYPLEDLRKGIA